MLPENSPERKNWFQKFGFQTCLSKTLAEEPGTQAISKDDL
jgi:hypothetical protein